MISMKINDLEIPVGSHYGRSIVFACDHRGYNAKHELMEFIKGNEEMQENIYMANKNFLMTDVGCFSEDRCDYPDFLGRAAQAVSLTWLETVGIVICGTGIGMAMAAGKYQMVYPARCLTVGDAIQSREHNNSNFLCLSAESKNLNQIVKAWMSASFDARQPYKNRFFKILEKDLDISLISP